MSGAPERAGATDQGSAAPPAGRKAPLYPFLFSLYPVLFLYLHNIREVAWTQALLAAAAALAIAIILWPATRFVAGGTEKRALASFLFLLLFHSYGSYYKAISGLLPGTLSPLAAHALVFIIPGGAWLFLTLALHRSRRDFTFLGRALGLAVLVLLAWNLGGILLHHGRSLWEQSRKESMVAATGAGGPDIYCFILDEFSAPEAARSLFQYDHSAFADKLRQMGFFVARDSRSPFLKTEYALAALLNPGGYDGRGDPFPGIRRNEVTSFLKRRGYRIIEFAVSPAMFMEGADQRHHYSLARVSLFFNDFYRTLFERSLLCFLPEQWSRHQSGVSHYYQERVLQVFRKMPAVVKSPGPKFVFAHVYCPHEPFVFDSRGGSVPRERAWDHSDPRNYLQQYIFISGKMLESAAAILADSPQPPVIIIQSDHGYRGSRGRKNWKRIVDPAEARKVFNALYLPGMPMEAIDPSLSPQNNFRLVFNLYFGTTYPLLPSF
jgi:hypothetical protein